LGPATNVFSFNAFSFKGELDVFDHSLAVLSQPSDDSYVRLNFEKAASGQYSALISMKRFQAHLFDLSSDIRVDIKVDHSASGEDPFIRGRVSSQSTFLDEKPVSELSGTFRLQNDKLTLDNISFGKILCEGSIEIRPPFNTNVTIKLSSVQMETFLNFWTDQETFDASGFVSGTIKVTGPVDKVFLDGKLESFDGHVEDLVFNKFLLNIEGHYPDMIIKESSVSQSEGMVFTFQGPINLAEQKDFFKQVSSLEIAPLVKDSRAEVEWTLKSSSQTEKGKTEIKYLLRKNPDHTSMGDEDLDMLGIENSFEF
jgi:hypothetical protein